MTIKPTYFTALAVTDSLTTYVAPVTKTTASAVTYTAAEIEAGLILRDPNGSGRADLFPTAADLFAAFGQPIANQSFRVVIRNTADAAETITMTTNTGLTLSGTMTIAQNNTKEFIGVFTSDTACTIYSVGTYVH